MRRTAVNRRGNAGWGCAMCERCHGYGELWAVQPAPRWRRRSVNIPDEYLVRRCGLCLGDGRAVELGVSG